MCRQDDEDAKRGLYNWMAQSQRLLTPIRLFVGTATMILVPYFLLPLEKVSWQADRNLVFDITFYLSMHAPSVARGADDRTRKCFQSIYLDHDVSLKWGSLRMLDFFDPMVV